MPNSAWVAGVTLRNGCRKLAWHGARGCAGGVDVFKLVADRVADQESKAMRTRRASSEPLSA